MPPFRTLTWAARLYLLTVIALGVGVVPLGLSQHHFSETELRDRLPALLYLAIGTQVAALNPIPWRAGLQSVIDPLLVATGLLAPGAPVGAVAWLATFDGRVPGRTVHWWVLVFNRASYAISHVVPSLLVYSIGRGHDDSWWALPLRTAAYVVLALALNYLTTALLFAYVQGTSFWATISQNVGIATFVTLAVSFSGGILYLLLYPGKQVGYVMALGLFGFVLAVRGYVAAAQHQTELNQQTLLLAADALDARDQYTESHSKNVSDLAGRLGEHLELGDRECENIRTAGSLHDLGKIGVRDDILNKAGPLTEEEWDIMRLHPGKGADMIEKHSALKEVAPSVRYHHERWDGSGYPSGLVGDKIPIGARVLAVADSFDTITGPRLYRQSLMTPIEGVEEVSRRAGRWYDPNVVDALRELHNLKPLEMPDRPPVPRRITILGVLRSNSGFSSLVSATAISSLGDPLTQVATLVSIYAATGNPRMVALAFIMQALGTIAISSALGGLTDRLPRRALVVTLEAIRAAILMTTPLLLMNGRWWLIIPVLFVLACINAVVQPARQAAVPGLVPTGQVGKANAIILATSMLGGASGFALAGGILATFHSTTALFIVDGVTFAAAAAIILGIRGLGGGVSKASVSGALNRTWSIVAARPHLVIGTLSAFLIPMSYPALLALAYTLSAPIGGHVDQSSPMGGQIYAVLEVVGSIGILCGSIVVLRFRAIGSMRTLGLGLLLTGAFSLVIWISPSLVAQSGHTYTTLYVAFLAVMLFGASIGNPVYAVANQTALIEAADDSNRGAVMSTRNGLVQTALIFGTAAGGLVTSTYGALAAYGILAIGLILLAMYALVTGRSTTSPHQGIAHDESQLGTAATRIV